MDKPTGHFPPGERWDGERQEVVFALVLQVRGEAEERLDCRVTAEAIEDAAKIESRVHSDFGQWRRDVLDGFRRLRRSKFEPLADRKLKAGRIGDCGDGSRRFIFISSADM